MAARYDTAFVDALTQGTAPDPAPADWDAATGWLTGSGSLEGVEPKLALSAIEAAVRNRSLPPLQALRNDRNKLLRKAARAGLHKLKSAGVEVPTQAAPRSFSLEAEQVEVPSRAFATPPNMEGYFTLTLSATDSEGSCALMVTGGGSQGVRESQHGHLSRSQLRSYWREMEERNVAEIRFVEGLHFAWREVERTKGITGSAPKDWDHFLTHVPEPTLAAARMHDPRRGLPTELGDGALEAAQALSQHPAFFAMPVDMEAVQAGVERLAQAASSALDVDEAAKAKRLDDILSETANAAITDEIRTEWVRRIEFAVALLRADGQDELAGLAGQLILAVEAGTPGGDLPLAKQAVQLWVLMAGSAGAEQGLGDFA